MAIGPWMLKFAALKPAFDRPGGPRGHGVVLESRSLRIFGPIGAGLAVLAACGTAVGDPAAKTGSTKATAGSGQIAKTTAAANAFAIGINVSGIDSWGGSRPFRNLIYGSSSQMVSPAGAGADVPAASLDANGWPKSIPAGYRIARGLSVPLAGGDFACRFQGSGAIAVEGTGVSGVSTAPGITRFTLATTYPNAQGARISYSVDPANYIRNLDCREATAPSGEVFAPEFMTALAGFKTIRFMKWQTASEGNWPVAWATRNKPGDSDYLKNDGVPIELLVDAANKAGTDLWVTVPWNADDAYITNFASYVRDNLAPGHQVYVEVSNEVWNGGYPVSAQAASEARAEALPSANGSATGGSLERYAEKTKQVMAVWSNVFSGRMDRLVRVASFQHVTTYFSDLLLGYQNLSQSVDALATAPYFGSEAKDTMTADQILTALPGQLNASVAIGSQQKAIAQKYGLRYLTYEAGQGLLLANNVPLEQQVERDPRMYDIYRQFVTAWRTQIGDQLTLFALTGGIGQYGAWGISEYAGQPEAQAPKLRATREFMGLTTAAATTAPVVVSPTQVCPDQSVIPVGRTC